MAKKRYNDRLYPRLVRKSSLATKKSLDVKATEPITTSVYRTKRENTAWWRIPLIWLGGIWQRIRLLFISPGTSRYKGLPYYRPTVNTVRSQAPASLSKDTEAMKMVTPDRDMSLRRQKKTKRPNEQKTKPENKINRYGGKILAIGLAAGTLLGIGSLLYYLVEGRYCVVTLNDNGTFSQLRTKEKTTGEMLSVAGITIEEGDIVTLPLSVRPYEGLEMGIRRASEVQIEADNQIVPVRLAVGTVQDALEKGGVMLGTADEVTPNMETPIKTGDIISVIRAKRIIVSTKKGDKAVMMATGTVGDALTKAGIDWDNQDKISPSPKTKIEEGMKISFVYAETKIVTKTYPVEFATVKKNSSSLTINTSKVSQKGVNGVRTVKEQITYHDGVETSRKVVSNTVTKKPMDKIILVGTKPSANPAVAKLPKNGPSSGMIKETIVADQITAYTWSEKRTATGKWPTRGMCAVNRKVIPYGTVLYIPGYGYAVAEDTGSGKGTAAISIDVYMDTKAQCLKWGRKRNVTVYILK